MRERFFTPRLRFRNYDELNAWLLDQCITYASNGWAFAALAPAITAILAIPILGEWPATSDWIAMLAISGGVYIASGAPLPVRLVEHVSPASEAEVDHSPDR